VRPRRKTKKRESHTFGKGREEMCGSYAQERKNAPKKKGLTVTIKKEIIEDGLRGEKKLRRSVVSGRSSKKAGRSWPSLGAKIFGGSLTEQVNSKGKYPQRETG